MINPDKADELREAIRNAPEYEPREGGAVADQQLTALDPANPRATAKEMIGRFYQQNGHRTLVHTGGEFLHWPGTHYETMRADTLKAEVYDFTGEAVTLAGEPFKPTRTRVENIIDAMKGLCELRGEVADPSWLTMRDDDPDPAQLLAARNGLLHLPTGTLHDHTPRLFNRRAVGYDFDPTDTMPEAWLHFVGQLWGDDLDAIRTLQQWFGYVLTADTRQQKILLLVGPKRSGKGTLARVLSELVGRANVCAPTLSGLSTNFGLSPLIGRTLGIISDARLSGRADQAVIAERLLSISGEDNTTIDRKHREPWTGKLNTRFMILTNELPRLADSSGALASRFVVLTLNKSFYGQEDPRLTEKLLAELPAILNWAVDGWRELQRVGHFETPESSREAVADLEDLGSPVAAFVRDRCEVTPGRGIDTKELYRAWVAWCESEGREHPGTAQTFSRDLRAAHPGIKTTSRRAGDSRWRQYEGIDLTADTH